VLEPFQYTEHHRFESERKKGLAGTLITHLVVLVILLISGFSMPQPQEIDKGILVNFGTDETGSGLIEPSPPQSSEEAAQVQIPEQSPADKDTKSATKEAPVLTQNYEKDAPSVTKKPDPEAEKKKKEQIENAKIRREELEAARIKKAAEDAENKRVADEQKRISDITNRTKNAFAGAKNTGTNSTSEGIAGGAGNQGDPNGSVNSKVRGVGSGTGTSGNGISYDLKGRVPAMIQIPTYEYQGEGNVVVEISVDREGIVKMATPGVKGSTTLDDYLLRVAKEAALKARFTINRDAPPVQKGTITFIFKLK
jgi:colicin import membrane protein